MIPPNTFSRGLSISTPIALSTNVLYLFFAPPLCKHIKVIVLTSFAMAGDWEKIMKAGFNGYIAKPINTRKLPIEASLSQIE
ncbi:MAG TPA: response regulator [Nitrospirae bacterium]|nr:response regulator [Nitrospirota bacterium]